MTTRHLYSYASRAEYQLRSTSERSDPCLNEPGSQKEFHGNESTDFVHEWRPEMDVTFFRAGDRAVERDYPYNTLC